MSTKSPSHAMARVNTFAFSGIEAVPVEVQVQIAGGLPALILVGLPDKAVAEARERVRAAFAAMGLSLPPKRILINLKPADLLKEDLDSMGPVKLSDVEKAQQEIINVAKRLESEGKIMIARGGDGDALV